MNSKPSVLIVGAGAMGLVAGFYLARGGSDVTFLVRPGRREHFQAPKLLYCHDDATLKTFDGYATIERIAEAQGRAFDYVIVTLDGATARSEAGTAMLREVGQAIAPTRALLMMGGVGIGLREHFMRSTGLPEERIMNGALALLSHQVSANLPVHSPTDAATIGKAFVAYRHFPNRASFLVDARHPAARDFAALYGRSGESVCTLMPGPVYELMGNVAFPMLAASEIAGWPPIAQLTANRELWRLAVAAQNEIASLPQFGWQGRLFALLMRPWVTAKLHGKIEQDALPLDYQAFNRFHHGDKVRAQDVQVMRNCLAAGRERGKAMPALTELLRRLDAQATAPAH